ncbi:hypothetical protein P0Y43_23095 [Pseudomonas entomophila]|uniref:hypothetical protein n=1 Tax=Pseudomonas entomophila TaxID=312306 RepID=UPI0023D8700E|nr:hypothetical protein [Pseudomonas entomophila]MDF0733583.1 hypothetical protein [Pseudomonas entomophila]
MPTENRSTMVSVPRELLQCASREPSGEVINVSRRNALEALRALLAQPAEHQGEPVAGEAVYQLRNTFVGNVWRDADKEAYDSAEKLAEYERRVLYTRPAPAAQQEPVATLYTAIENGFSDFACLGALDGGSYYKMTPLYTHADPGEVERLREEVEKQRRLKMLVAENLQNALANCSVYRYQLNEQSTLLQLGLTMINRGIVSFDDQIEYRQKLAALSASAEQEVKS